MAAAFARRYGDRFLAAVAAQPNESVEDAIAAYRLTFRQALDRDGRMCLCGVLGAEASVLSPWRGADHGETFETEGGAA